MKILMIQHSPCARNIKYSITLRRRGHEVHLGYTGKEIRYMGVKTSDVYNSATKYKSPLHTRDHIEEFDIVHSHNSPDELTVIAQLGNRPVIHDTHDLTTLHREREATRGEMINELTANLRSDGRIYVNRAMEGHVRKAMGMDKHCVVVSNYAVLPDDYEFDYSARNENKVIYMGGISFAAHRNYPALFEKMINDKRSCFELDVFPAVYNEDVHRYFSYCKGIRYNAPVNMMEVINKMKSYSVGLLPFLPEKHSRWWEHVSHSTPNKLYEYWAAGLSVVAPRLAIFEGLIPQGAGVLFSTYDELIEAIPRAARERNPEVIKRCIRTYDDQIEKVEDYYRFVIDTYRSKHD